MLNNNNFAREMTLMCKFYEVEFTEGILVAEAEPFSKNFRVTNRYLEGI